MQQPKEKLVDCVRHVYADFWTNVEIWTTVRVALDAENRASRWYWTSRRTDGRLDMTKAFLTVLHFVLGGTVSPLNLRSR